MAAPKVALAHIPTALRRNRAVQQWVFHEAEKNWRLCWSSDMRPPIGRLKIVFIWWRESTVTRCPQIVFRGSVNRSRVYIGVLRELHQRVAL